MWLDDNHQWPLDEELESIREVRGKSRTAIHLVESKLPEQRLDSVQIFFTHKEINISHRPRRYAAVEPFGERETAQGQAGDPLIAERAEERPELSGESQVSQLLLVGR